MPFRFQFGIPARIAGARSLLGRLRGEDGTITPVDDTPKEEYDKVTGLAPRDPGHVVTGEYDPDLDETTVSNVRAYASYPSRVVATESEPMLVAKIRGPIEEDEEGNPIFPAVRIVARPLATQINYQWTGPAHNPLTGELDTLWKFQGDPSGTYESNEALAQAAFSEYGSTRVLTETNFWRAEDVPEGHTPPYQAPTDAEYDVTAYPRHPSADGPYDWQKYETWDFRYRLPTWYNTEQAELGAEPYPPPITTGYLIYYKAFPASWPEETNPFGGVFLAPVIPGFYVQGGAASIPPIFVPYNSDPYGGQTGITQAVETLTAQPQLKFTENIRKLYPYSFGIAATNSQHSTFPTFTVYDNKAPEWWGAQYTVPWFNDMNVFRTNSSWTLEITAEDCCWCRGYRIKGKVKFKKYFFNLNQEGTVGRATMWSILNPFRPWGTAIGDVEATIWPGMRFRVERDIEGNDLPPVSAGELDWEVTLDSTNATGSPVRFLTFNCFETTMVDGVPVQTPPLYGEVNELVYISDFYITEILPPVAP